MRHKNITLLLVVMMMLAGVFSLVKIPKNEFPQFNVPVGLIVGVYPGASEQEVEHQLAGPMEEFLWMALTSFAFDLIIHMVLGFGINEVYIMSGGWLFVVPIAIAYAFKNIRGRLHIALRLLIILLALWLYVWNLRLLIGYLVS